VTENFASFVRRVPSFHTLPPADKLQHAAWYLHSQVGKEHVTTSDINQCFDHIHVQPPHISVYLKRLSERKPPVFLRSKLGYRLEGTARKALTDRYGQAASTLIVSSLLRDLTKKIATSEERTFLEETLRCYSVGAFRAAIVMAWNLAYSHIETWLLSDPTRSERFNASYAIKFSKRSERLVDQDSFAAFKEYDLIETLGHAKLISKNVGELLKEKLKRRNAAAHPSTVTITQAQADDVITDLVNNVVARLG
jgi:hypothetical protein